MPRLHVLAALAALALPASLLAQAPTAYTITEGGPFGQPTVVTVSRNGDKALIDIAPASGGAHTLTYYDLKTGTSYSWDPSAKPISCSTGRFSGDWGDPFAMTAEVTASVAKGDLKLTGNDTLNGVPVKVYEGSSPQGKSRVLLDPKSNLVMRATFTPPTGAAMTMADVKKVVLGPPPASAIALPAACAGQKAEPTEEERIAAETGEPASNFVNAIYGPGSKNSCSVVLRVLRAGSMTPITSGFQVAIDPTYDQDHPPSYDFGVHTDGSQTYSGGGVREITSQIHNGMVRIDNPPPYFNFDVNVYKPGSAGGMGLIYRQCFAPTTVLLYIAKDSGGDYLWVKSGKYATPPRP